MAGADPNAPLQPVDAAGRLQCLECGNWYRSLASHLRASEDMSADEYRERHGLAAGHPLVSQELSETWSEQTRTRQDRGDLTSIAELPADKWRAASSKGNARHRETAPRPEVKAAHQAAVVKGRSQAHANRRAALDALARDLNHPDWAAFIRETAHLSVNQVGRMTGRNPKTIAYWRQKLLGAGWATAGARLHPRRAAAYARLDAEFATRGWVDLAAACSSVGRRGLQGVAAAVGSKPATLQAWDAQRRTGGETP
ncbi:MucR family transcriptional regulator [Streptomyces sp. 8L]|uniref:MucR family transcriptional regulator n=1 Tax=Streptomyces sp. 8L TaxID=2877242 RepID=UPI001CD41E7F|nr:MucR family transcriptional regulator [Streptomyces sp. 8L]MCA1221401.1 MucR family transcriptional regulator [Streptomyces sp. 8L]